ncbi:MAG: hypothetical protein VKJ24_18150 [Synechococcales bacterium]|nr:hypothetical protein [Synechococcales bacterium]
MGETLRIGFVVVHQLPVSPDTLLLRLLGKGSVQRQAIAELLELPEQPLKSIVLENLIKLEVMLKSRRRRSKLELNAVDRARMIMRCSKEELLQELS